MNTAINRTIMRVELPYDRLYWDVTNVTEKEVDLYFDMFCYLNDYEVDGYVVDGYVVGFPFIMDEIDDGPVDLVLTSELIKKEVYEIINNDKEASKIFRNRVKRLWRNK